MPVLGGLAHGRDNKRVATAAVGYQLARRSVSGRTCCFSAPIGRRFPYFVSTFFSGFRIFSSRLQWSRRRARPVRCQWRWHCSRWAHTNREDARVASASVRRRASSTISVTMRGRCAATPPAAAPASAAMAPVSASAVSAAATVACRLIKRDWHRRHQRAASAVLRRRQRRRPASKTVTGTQTSASTL